jgi:hypothetical protein
MPSLEWQRYSPQSCRHYSREFAIFQTIVLALAAAALGRLSRDETGARAINLAKVILGEMRLW